MNKSYRLIKNRDHYIFKRLTYPRFETLLDLQSMPVIKEVRYFENCTASELESVMREVASNFRQFFMESSGEYGISSLMLEELQDHQ